jgi:signal transduction histidine kinase/ligand-binding sensor domain-containing protein/DNA-binding response OmpR family regulator
MRRKIIIILTLLLSINGLCLNAQADLSDNKFRTLSPDGGLGNNPIIGFVQSKSGFVWVLMSDELFRFEGYSFKRYSGLIKRFNNTNKWNFTDIEEDASGNLYLASNNGLLQYNYSTDNFDLIDKSYIQTVKEDFKGNLWLLRLNRIGVFDREKRTFQEVGLSGGKPMSTDDPLLSIDKKNLFFANRKGEVYRFDSNHNEFKLEFKLEIGSKFTKIKQKGNLLWLLTQNDGLFGVDSSNGKIIKQYNFFSTGIYKNVPARSLWVDEKFIWIGTQKGLYKMNPLTGEYFHYEHSKSDPYSIPNNSIWKIFEDKLGNKWFGTFAGGIAYLNASETSKFSSYLTNMDQTNHSGFSCFLEDKNELWIGTQGGGLSKFNKNLEKITSFRHDANRNSLSFDNISALASDNQNRIWIGTILAGIDMYDLKSGKFYNFNSKDSNKKILYDHIVKFEAEADSGIWISYAQGSQSLTYLSFKNTAFHHLIFSATEKNTLYGGDIIDITRDKEGLLWVASQNRLHWMDVKKKILHLVPVDSIQYPILLNMNIQTVYADDKSNSIWIGTVENGLIRYDKQSKKFEVLNSIFQYNIQSVYSICADNSGNIWMGTNNGLLRYNPNNKTYNHFDKRDGLVDRVYYLFSCYKDKSGLLYFGGNDGFTVVNPEKLKLNSILPKALITELFVDNNPVSMNSENSPLTEPITITNKVILSHNQQNFGFEISSSNYFIPEKNRFKYRLKGYDDKWLEVDAGKRTISYTKVPAGRYTFEVLASNNDGIWSSEPKIIEVVVKPAPWLSWWAYLIYLVLFGAIGYTILYYYLRQKQYKLKLYYETLDAKQQEENHQAQLRFFTNISHDFKTPISLILASLDRIDSDKINIPERLFNNISNNAKRLLNLVNELMDFRTVENGIMHLKLSESNINEFVEFCANDFKEHAIQRKIYFQLMNDAKLFSLLYFDVRIMEKIVLNLLNNAFKYTKNGGQVTVQTFYDITDFHSNYANSSFVNRPETNIPMFGFVIHDTGVGISAESIAHVFDRFYRVEENQDDLHIGSGVGLALVKSLVSLHKGMIAIYSERNVGTDILVAFPKDKDIYNEEDFVNDLELNAMEHKLNSLLMDETIAEDTESDIEDENYFSREKKRILIAEDNSELRQLISDALMDNFDICQAENGLLAAQMLDTMEVDIIISDIMMPEKDGITFCLEVKQNVDNCHIPFIMMTAKGGLDARIDGIDSGADAYLEKPISIKLLKLTIQNLLKQQNRVREYYAKNIFVDGSEVIGNQRDNEFIKKFINVVDKFIGKNDVDINYIAMELSMSRSKLYAKVKGLTNKTIVDFIRTYRLRKAAKLMIEDGLNVIEAMDVVGIESASYFSHAFKKEFGETPSGFVARMKGNQTQSTE